MKTFAIATLLLFFSVLAWAGNNSNQADYTINVHVNASHLVFNGRSIAYAQKLDVVIDGKKYELESTAFPNAVLAIGDYRARLTKDEHMGTYDSIQVYEFLFPDQKTRKFMLVGQTE